MQVNGSLQATTVSTLSDIRIKSNVQPLSPDMTVDALRPVTYFNNQTQRPDMGLIAHEVQAVYPMLVTGSSDSDTMQSINYQGLIPVLIQEIQQLKRDIQQLKETVRPL